MAAVGTAAAGGGPCSVECPQQESELLYRDGASRKPWSH